MADIPDNVDLNWSARTLVALRDDVRDLKSDLRHIAGDAWLWSGGDSALCAVQRLCRLSETAPHAAAVLLLVGFAALCSSPLSPSVALRLVSFSLDGRH